MSSRTNTADIEALIGARIRSRRIQARMSQEMLGQALGVSFQQIQKYEKGTNRVSAGRLLKIADVLDCKVMEFFEGMGSGKIGASAPFSKFLATNDGVAIIEAMLRIEDEALRRTVIDIAERLAEV